MPALTQVAALTIRNTGLRQINAGFPSLLHATGSVLMFANDQLFSLSGLCGLATVTGNYNISGSALCCQAVQRMMSPVAVTGSKLTPKCFTPCTCGGGDNFTCDGTTVTELDHEREMLSSACACVL